MRRDVLVADLLAGEGEHLVQAATGRRATLPSAARTMWLRASSETRMLLPASHLAQMGQQLLGRDHAEVVLLAAREDRVGDLVVLGRREDELDPGRRLLEGLQERVEGPRREHVDLVDDPDLVAVAGRVVARALAQLADLLDAVVRGAVDLLDVQRRVPPRSPGTRRTRRRARAWASRPREQLRALARMRAVVVLPTPRAPESRNAWPIRPVAIAFLSVRVTVAWPTTSSKVRGRDLRART